MTRHGAGASWHIRTGRSLRQRLHPPAERHPTPLFLECRPSDQVYLTDFDKGAEGQALRRLDEERVRELGELDRLLATAQLRDEGD